MSGGRHEQLLACVHGSSLNGKQMPSKFAIGAEIGPVPFFFWTTGSFALVCARPCSSSLSRALTDVIGSAGITGKLLAAGETPSKRPLTTFGPNEDDAALAV